jgi:hypothetical protein
MSSPARKAPGTVKHMPRAPRIEYPKAIHHITQRGNRRDAIFVTEADYQPADLVGDRQPAGAGRHQPGILGVHHQVEQLFGESAVKTLSADQRLG